MFDLMPFNRREDNLFHYLDNLEKNFWGDLATNVSSFRTDVLDKGDKFVLEAELPGFQKEDIDIHVEGNTLTISAQHKEESEEKKDGKFVRRERKYGSFTRSFDISDIDQAKINASYDNGILSVELPKQVEVVPAPTKIDIKSGFLPFSLPFSPLNNSGGLFLSKSSPRIRFPQPGFLKNFIKAPRSRPHFLKPRTLFILGNILFL